MIQFATIFIGILGGMAVGIQTPIASAIGQRLGSAASSVVVHVCGTIFSIIFLIVYRGDSIRNWRDMPWWMYFVGLFGVILYLTINFTVPRIGAAAAISLIIVGQLLMGMAIDHWGLFGTPVHQIDGLRAMGILLLVTGSYLIVR